MKAPDVLNRWIVLRMRALIEWTVEVGKYLR